MTYSKKLLFVLFLICNIGRAQLTLENIYPASIRFYLTQIAQNEYKYLWIDPQGNAFKLYNLNHSLMLSETVPITYSASSSVYNITFVSRSLFDCDSTNIEYGIVFLGNGGPGYPNPYFAVYRTNGVLFQKIDSVRFLNYSTGVMAGTYNNHTPVINTPAGSKLILAKPNGQPAIYSLCGNIPTGIVKNGGDTFDDALPFPNPTNKQITLPYTFPGNETKGKMLIYNNSGQIIKEFDVDNTFNSIVLNTTDLSPGIFFYELVVKGKKSGAQKFIVAD